VARLALCPARNPVAVANVATSIAAGVPRASIAPLSTIDESSFDGYPDGDPIRCWGVVDGHQTAMQRRGVGSRRTTMCLC
jgi:hypothetical protein